MKPVSAAIVLRLWNARLRRPAWLAAASGALLLAAAPAAAVDPTPCDPIAAGQWGRLRIPAYDFSYVSLVEGRGSAAAYFHCVRNNHPRRAVRVDWRGAGLSSPIPPGETIYQTGPAAGRVRARRPSPFYYGARPSLIQVMTLASAGDPLRGPAPWRATAPFRRAAFWQGAPVAPAAAGPVGTTASLVYVPVDAGFLYGFSRRPLSRAATSEWLESHPRQLAPFVMSFENDVRVDGEGRVAIVYTCRYWMPELEGMDAGRFYLRFTDPALHRLMFNGAAPFAIADATDYNPALRAWLPPLARGQVAARTAELHVLLADRRTVVATIPVAFSGPPAS